ncbi:hypothetical protein F5Y16DRAFT_368590 [Xylariaceae sp. FL0255]|nr:hypothetical protein F5Y16DRAFT_368590 [Xylariaceae sp. FL0255]
MSSVQYCTPPSGSGEIPCGTICCASWQFCALEGQCSFDAGYSSTASSGSTSNTSDGETNTSTLKSQSATTSSNGISQSHTSTTSISSPGSTTTSIPSTTSSLLSSNTGNPSSLSSAGGSNSAHIVGPVVGVLIPLVIITAALWFYRKRRCQPPRVQERFEKPELPDAPMARVAYELQVKEVHTSELPAGEPMRAHEVQPFAGKGEHFELP